MSRYIKDELSVMQGTMTCKEEVLNQSQSTRMFIVDDGMLIIRETDGDANKFIKIPVSRLMNFIG
jgi:hypothetical protein